MNIDLKNILSDKTNQNSTLKIEKKIKNIKKNFLNNNNYFIILKNLGENSEDIKKKTIKFAKLFGDTIEQNLKGEKIISVKPNITKLRKFKKTNVKNKLRYHQTNLGGSIHSDGPQLINPPKYVLMACLNQSNEGGESIIVNTKKIFQTLKKKNPRILKTLKEKYLFEQRGFYKKKVKVLNKPIFTNKNKNLKFRYLRDYILSAYKLKNRELSPVKCQAMKQLDSMLSSRKYQKKYKLQMGDMIIINNNILAHGRTGFSIKDKKNIREILRIWLKN